MILIYFLLTVGFCLLLIKATDILTDCVHHFSSFTVLNKFAATALLIALVNALPELMVGINAVLAGKSALAFGTILGSNIANLSLVVGGAALVSGSVAVSGEWLRQDTMNIFLTALLPISLLVDGRISRLEGLILIAIYIFYAISLLRGRQQGGYYPQEGDYRLRRLLLTKNKQKKITWWFGWFIVGGIMLIVSGEMVVKYGLALANILSIPAFLIGLLMAVGTTLPELFFEIEAIRKHEAAMVWGNLSGQLMANSALTLGILSLISPIVLPDGLTAYLLTISSFVLVCILFWIFTKTKKKLERWEGAALVGVYLVFMAVEWLTK
ncbi:MAG: sodium:calcium antiporter [Candidatus Beckwithbacteria bacterium]|nr:sodium:calcium antiporter [Candidatus Beckwithbacteria bacterium]